MPIPPSGRGGRGSRERGRGGEEKFLKPILAPAERKRTLVYDVESKHQDTQKAGWSRAFLVGFWDGERYTAFRNEERGERKIARWQDRAIVVGGCVDRFMRFVLGKEEFATSVAKIYAHNGGRFDSTFILAWLQRHTDEFSYEILSVHGRAQVVEVWYRGANRKEQSWSFTDSVLVLQMTLEKAGELFCPTLRKLKSFPLGTNEADTRWEEYNRIDCEVLAQALDRFQDLVENLGGTMGLTAPATAMSTFRRGFQADKFHRNAHFKACKSKSCDGCLQQWVLDSYHGGRTEIFRMRAPSGLYYYDINSSYAAAMLDPMPVGPAKEFDGETSWTLLRKMTRDHVGFVECEVYVPEDCEIPPLPHVIKAGKFTKKLIFPTGTFSGIWDIDELELLQDPLVGGRIVEIYRSVWFKKDTVFSNFINTLYKLRDKKSPKFNAALSELAKLLMNSLYGKFAMKRDREKLVSIMSGDPWPKNEDGSFARPINGDHDHCLTWICQNRIDAPYIIPQISAHITALARIRLWKGMASVIRKGGKVYYTDTDSVMCSIRMDEGSKLGEWKREYPSSNLAGNFVLPKLYALTNAEDEPYKMEKEVKGKKKEVLIQKGEAVAVRMKGVGRGWQNLENFEKLISGGTVTFNRLEQHRTTLRKGRSGPLRIKADKKLRTTYDKRILLDNGETRPIILGCDIIEERYVPSFARTGVTNMSMPMTA